ncbi:MAG TPA: hypothetical protein VHW01_08400, partial [Polyangiaceae bacterium]|nr:hypothetical protein [Polyangiaceae bacterium]
AGTHTLTATHANQTQRWEIAFAPGRNETHDFDFSEKPAAAAAPVAPVVAPTPITQPPAPAPESASPMRTAGFVTAGVGVAAVIGGVITGLMAKGKETDAKALCRGTVCPQSASTKFDSASSLATVSNILFIGGGVVAATGVGLIVFGGPKAEPEKTARLTGFEIPDSLRDPRRGEGVTLRVLPAVGRDGAALWAAGSF